MMECFGRDLGPRLFRNIRKQHPRITLQVFVGGTDAFSDQLSAGHLDAAVAFNMPARPDIKTVFTVAVPIGVAVAPSHPQGRARLEQTGVGLDDMEAPVEAVGATDPARLQPVS